ncbi:MAG: tRNA nucleotidyltransferase/poly(A) polymerase [Planctomycetota bacterium]
MHRTLRVGLAGSYQNVVEERTRDRDEDNRLQAEYDAKSDSSGKSPRLGQCRGGGEIRLHGSFPLSLGTATVAFNRWFPPEYFSSRGWGRSHRMNTLTTQWNRLSAERRAAVLSVARTLRAAGYRAWLVGGAVRDLCLGEDVGDLDMVSAALPDEVVRLFPGAREVGRSFGIVQVLGAGQWIELATFRLERGYSDGRHPDEVRYTDSLVKDAGRRDFTCNAMYWDPLECELADPKGGMGDLERRELACVGDARGRFDEDGLRLLRMARFLARLGLKPAPGLFEAAAASKSSLRGVSGERILHELRRMAEGPRPQVALEALACSQILGLAVSVGENEVLDQEALRLKVCKAVLDGSHAETGKEGSELGVVLSILLDPDPGACLEAKLIKQTAKKAFKRLRASTDLAQQVTDLWRLRSYFRVAPEESSTTIRALREPQGLPALDLAQAWNTSLLAESPELEALKDWFLALPEARIRPDFLPSGQQLMEGGIVAGPGLGQLLQSVEDAALMGLVDDAAAALNWALSQDLKG